MASLNGSALGALGSIVTTARASGTYEDSEDATSVHTDTSDGSGDLWDEFENGSLADDDSRSSESDRTDDMLSASGRIVNWDDSNHDDDEGDYHFEQQKQPSRRRKRRLHDECFYHYYYYRWC